MRPARPSRSNGTLRALGCAAAALVTAFGFAGDGFGHFRDPPAARTQSWQAPAPVPLSETAWLSGAFDRVGRLRLAPLTTLSVIHRYQRPWENHTPEWRRFFDGRYGVETAPAPELSWRMPEAFLPLALPVEAEEPCPRWKRPRPLTVVRYAGESAHMPLFDCSGAVAPDVIDRLSVLARAPETPRPSIPLPETAHPGAPGEWLPGLRLIDPRLVWVLGQIQASFPGHRVVIMSGYRPDAHTSNHRRGKALDLYVEDVPNDVLFGLCRTLRDVGCGYYPHNVFVHFDVRRFGAGRVTWVDASEPGTPSHYVDGWPGVLPPGVGWLGRH